MTYSFRPAVSFDQRHGLFIAVTGGTNSGKSFSAMRLARGIAGPKGKIAAADTEGGRLLHLKRHFEFDVVMLNPPHRPENYANVARQAEEAGYGVLVIDSFSMEWVGLGGVLDWQAEEYKRLGGREQMKLASWIAPKMAHKAMVYSFLQRRIPIVFSIRAEEKAKKVGSEVRSEWAPICNKAFPFEVTVSFMLTQDRQGIIDLQRPNKMEGAHREFFRDGDQLSEEHGARLAAWAQGGHGEPAPAGDRAIMSVAEAAAAQGVDAFTAWWKDAGRAERAVVNADRARLKQIAEAADAAAKQPGLDDDDPFGLPPIAEAEPTTAAPPAEPARDWPTEAKDAMTYLDAATSEKSLQVRLASAKIAALLSELEAQAPDQHHAVMAYVQAMRDEFNRVTA